MSNPLIHNCDHYVILEPGKQEEILTAQETLQWLESWLKTLDELPEDLSNLTPLTAAAKRLIDTACDLEIKPGFHLQWFAVRLEPPHPEA